MEDKRGPMQEVKLKVSLTINLCDLLTIIFFFLFNNYLCSTDITTHQRIVPRKLKLQNTCSEALYISNINMASRMFGI